MKTSAVGSVILILVFASLSGHQPVARAAPGQGALYGTSGSMNPSLLTIDPATGLGTTVGPLPIPFPAIAVHPTTGVLYGGGGAGVPFLVKLNKSNAALTVVGDTRLGSASMSDMDFSANGTLFASVNITGDGGTGGDHLATIDIATGMATIVGPFGVCVGVVVPSVGGGKCSIEGMEGLAFSPSGTLYATHTLNSAVGPHGLYTVNTVTGAATFVAPILNALGQPPDGGIASIHFGCNGVLYGGTTRLAPTNGGHLVTINPMTGIFANVSTASATDGSALAALAFDNSTCSTDLAITKVSGATGTTAPGTTITYTVTVINNGPGAAVNVAISDPIPANTTFESLSQTSGPMFIVQAPAAGDTGTITLTLANMLPGQSAVFRIVLRVSQTALGTMVNTATVSNAVTDNNPGNNSASSAIGIQSAASPPATLTPQPSAPPTIPQVFQNPGAASIFTSPKRVTATQSVQAVAESQTRGASRPPAISPPRTGDGGLLAY
jgi:uncharacterized repeat protein (TIGR01451 family)